MRHTENKIEFWVFVLILVIATFFRLWQLDVIPPGLHPYEAINGNSAVQALESGEYRVFYPENNGREGLFINVQALSIWFFGNTAFALRIVSALFGIATVAGLYMLARILFNWHIAALSGFLMSISFWHVNFSRIGFRAIAAPFMLVWGLYYFWRGLRSGRLWDFAISGLFWGLGFYTYLSFRLMPLVLLLALVGYWQTIHSDFSHTKYTYTIRKMMRNFAVFATVVVIITTPLIVHFVQNPEDISERTSKVSVFSTENPVSSIMLNTVETIGMFTFYGDWNWSRNIPGNPTLAWPVGVLFAVGLVRSLAKLFRPRRHAHLSSVQTLCVSWFFIGLLPAILSSEGIPHAIRVITTAPVIFLFAGEGLWWLIINVERFYRSRDLHHVHVTLPYHHRIYLSESIFVAILFTILILSTTGAYEYYRYFHVWGSSQNVSSEFASSYVSIANQISELPDEIPKYIVVNSDDIYVDDISIHAQTIMYLTNTSTPAKQKQKNIFYITEEQYWNKDLSQEQFGIFFPLTPLHKDQ